MTLQAIPRVRLFRHVPHLRRGWGRALLSRPDDETLDRGKGRARRRRIGHRLNWLLSLHEAVNAKPRRCSAKCQVVRSTGISVAGFSSLMWFVICSGSSQSSYVLEPLQLSAGKQHAPGEAASSSQASAMSAVCLVRRIRSSHLATR